MGRRKSKVQRLPPSERTVIGSKVLIFEPPPALVSNSGGISLSQNVPTELHLAEAASSPPSAEFSNLRLDSRPSAPHIELDDDSLRKILRLAGPVSILSAARVCRKWRRVALEILSDTSHVDLTSLTRRCIISDLTYSSVLRTAYSFPNMTSLSLRNFTHTDILPEVAGFVMTRLRSSTLRDADFSGLDFSAADIAAILDACPNLTVLRMCATSSVTYGVLQTLVNTLGGNTARAPRTLDFVDVSRCDGVEREGLTQLLTRGRIGEVKATECRNVRVLGGNTSDDLSVKRINLHGCKNLLKFRYYGGTLEHLNLSQCPSLTLLGLHSRLSDTPLNARVLNLASCARLRALSFGGWENEMGIFDHIGTLPSFGLSKLEELLLTGARSLSAATILKAFGISQSVCAMPKLRRLEVIGCQIEELRLRGYTNLERVDCSGCSHLNVVEVADSFNISFLNLSSRRSPMARVQITIPSKAMVNGIRESWSWQATDSMQVITYGV